VIAVPAGISLQQGHQVAGEVEAEIDTIAPGADVVVHVDMLEPQADDLPTRVRSIAAARGVRVHALHAPQSRRPLEPQSARRGRQRVDVVRRPISW